MNERDVILRRDFLKLIGKSPTVIAAVNLPGNELEKPNSNAGVKIVSPILGAVTGGLGGLIYSSSIAQGAIFESYSIRRNFMKRCTLLGGVIGASAGLISARDPRK